MPRLLLACFVTTVVLSSLEVRAQESSALERADAAYARGALLEASRAYEAALREPGHERDALVRIHLRLGVTSIARRQERAAQGHFRAALALDPTLPAPPELAPDARARFEALRPPPPAPVEQTAPVDLAPTEAESASASEAATASEGATVSERAASEHATTSERATMPETTIASEAATVTPSVSAPAAATGAASVAATGPQTETGATADASDLPGPILTLEQCLADPACGSDSPRRCSLDPRCIVEPSHRGPEWYEHPVFWAVAGIVVIGAAAGGTIGYLVVNPPGYVLAAPEVR